MRNLNKKWIWVILGIAVIGSFLVFKWISYQSSLNSSPQISPSIEAVDADSFVEKGRIVVGFKKGISQTEAEALLRKNKLEFLKTDNINQGQKFFYESGEKFIVAVPIGQEQLWIDMLGKL